VRVLILGGTAFLGVHLTNELLRRGHEVTHFNRGKTGSPAAGVRTITGDRTIGFDGLQDERFDAVIDTSGYVPHVVDLAARFFESRTDRYAFVSTVSVYDLSLGELLETSPKPPLPADADPTVLTMDIYGPLKTLCEAAVNGAYGDRSTIVRPGLIVGPFDPTDRFTYWPVRFARGGEVLAPGTPDRATQFVDARDLAIFTVHLLERDASGVYNVTSPQNHFTLGGVMTACAAVAGVPSTVRWVADEVLVEKGVAPWTDLPLWVPPSSAIPGLLNTSVTKALDAGLTIRPLEETVRDTLDWSKTRGDHQPKVGLSEERELEVLSR
jgi:2'-hydroxyisoflavone reductase